MVTAHASSERRGAVEGFGNANTAAHCNLGAKNECVLCSPLTPVQSRSTAQRSFVP